MELIIRFGNDNIRTRAKVSHLENLTFLHNHTMMAKKQPLEAAAIAIRHMNFINSSDISTPSSSRVDVIS